MLFRSKIHRINMVGCLDEDERAKTPAQPEAKGQTFQERIRKGISKSGQD
jgi:hypothetical protein